MADNLTFDATLEDNVTPNLDKLEKQLKAMGQSPVQIKMVLQAVDQATPKIKDAQKHLDRMPKEHTIFIGIKSGLQTFKEELHKFKQELLKPITVPFRFTDQGGKDLGGSGGPLDALAQVRSKVALPLMGSLPGSSMLYGVGAGAGVAGAVTGLSAIMQDSIKSNSDLEQAHQKLTIALRDNSGAVTETNKVIAASQKTPFTFQQNLQADVLGRSFQLPMWKGENPQVPQGYLKTAGNMAAAMGSTPDDAMLALAMARQHMFRRLQPFGIRMTASDYGAGGRYAGMSVDQAIAIATRRFQGAMGAQMQTFSGMMSNIKDVLSQQVMRPLGQTAFAAVHQATGSVEKGLQDPNVERKLGTAVEKVQHLTVQILQNIQKMRGYFEMHLKKPIDDVIVAVTKLGKTFTQAFGGTTGVVIQTFAEALMSITEPLAQISKEVPGLGKMLGYMKALEMLHMSGLAGSFETWKKAFTPGSGQGLITGLIKGLLQLPTTLAKVGGFFAIKSILDAHKATSDMNDQFKDMKGHLDTIDSQVGRMAQGLAQSTTHMKNLVTLAAHGIDPRGRIGGPKSRQITGQERVDLSEQVAQAGIKFQSATGMKSTDIVSAITDAMKGSNEYSYDALHKFGTQLIEVTAVAKDFGQTFDDVKRIMATFAQPASRVGLGGLHGAPTLTALSTTLNKLPVDQRQQAQGLYTPDSVLTAMLQQYGYPSIENLKTIPQGQLGQYWHFKNAPGAVKRYGQDERTFEQQARSASQLQGTARSVISRDAPSALQGQFAVRPVPVLWSQQHLGTDFSQFNKPGQTGAQSAERVRQEWERTVNLFATAQKEIARYSADVDKTQNYLDQLSKAQAAVNLQMQAFQHVITLAQRHIEDANLALQKYTLDNLRPLERELTRVQNAMDLVNHTMSDAQYNMTKFADGLLTGEQAALNQLHALQLYNQQLEYLKMQYTQIGSELGSRTYERGYSARVQPLMGLSLELQMQRLQRKQQMEQAKYDLNYGEGHYQMQQAQRSQWQRTEMPLSVRLAGITSNQKVIDQATIQAHQIGEVQFGLQQKMFKVNEVIADQNDKIQRLQIHLTELQQSKKMREFENEQFHLGQTMGTVTQKLDRQNIALDAWKNTVDDLNSKKQDLQNLFDTMMSFHELNGQNQFGAARTMIREGGKTGLLPGGHWQNVNRGGSGGQTWVPGQEEKQLLASIDKAQRDYNKAQDKLSKVWTNYAQKADWKDLLRESFKGLFTGDTFRKLADALKGSGWLGDILSPVVGALANVAPILTVAATALAGIGALTWSLRRLAFPVAGRALSLGGHVIDKGLGLAGVETHFGPQISRLTDGLATKFADKLKTSLPESIVSKFEPFLHPIKSFKSGLLFKGIGAAVGAALTAGHPGGIAIGGYLGGKVYSHFHKEIKGAADELSKVKGAAKDASEWLSGKPSAVKNAAHDAGEWLAGKAPDSLKNNARAAGNALHESKGKITTFADELAGKAPDTLRGALEGVKTKAQEVEAALGERGLRGAIKNAATELSNLIPKIGTMFGLHIPKIPLPTDHLPIKPNLPHASSVLSGETPHIPGGAAAETERGVSAALRGATGKGLTSALHDVKGMGVGLKAGLSVLNKVAIAYGVGMVGKDLLAGNWGKAGMDAAYLTPAGIPLLARDVLSHFGISLQLFGKRKLTDKQIEEKIKVVAAKSFKDLGWWAQNIEAPSSIMSDPTYASLMPGGAGASGRGYKEQRHMYGAATGFQTQTIEAIQSLKKGDMLDAAKHFGAAKKYAEDYYYWLKKVQADAKTARRMETQFNDQYNALDRAHKNRFHQLSAADQDRAQQAALTGPHGLQNYLNSRVTRTTNSFKAENAATDAGFKALKATIVAQQNQIGTALNKAWTHILNQAGINPKILKGPVGTLGAAPKGLKHAAGGLIHGLNDSIGHLITAGEEGDEMIIPLTPNRRGRAKQLLAQTRGIVGYAEGGMVRGRQHPDSQIMSNNIYGDQGMLYFEKYFKETAASLQGIEKEIRHMRQLIKETKDIQEKKKDTETLAKLNEQLRETNKVRQDAQRQYNRAVSHNIVAAGDLTGGESTLAGVTNEQSILRGIRQRAGRHGRAGADRTYIEGAAIRGLNVNLLRDTLGHGLNRQQMTAYEKLENAMAPSAHTSRAQLVRLKKNLDVTLGGQKHSPDSRQEDQFQRVSKYQDKHVEHMGKVEGMLERLVAKDTVVYVNNQVSGGAQVQTTQSGRRKSK